MKRWQLGRAIRKRQVVQERRQSLPHRLSLCQSPWHAIALAWTAGSAAVVVEGCAPQASGPGARFPEFYSLSPNHEREDRNLQLEKLSFGAARRASAWSSCIYCRFSPRCHPFVTSMQSPPLKTAESKESLPNLSATQKIPYAIPLLRRGVQTANHRLQCAHPNLNGKFFQRFTPRPSSQLVVDISGPAGAGRTSVNRMLQGIRRHVTQITQVATPATCGAAPASHALLYWLTVARSESRRAGCSPRRRTLPHLPLGYYEVVAKVSKSDPFMATRAKSFPGGCLACWCRVLDAAKASPWFRMPGIVPWQVRKSCARRDANPKLGMDR